MITIEVTGVTEMTQRCKSDNEALKFLKQLKKTYDDGGLKIKVITEKFIKTQQNLNKMNTSQNLIQAIAHSKATNTAKTLSSMLYDKGVDISVRGLRNANFNEIHVWTREDVMNRFLSDKDHEVVNSVISDYMDGKTPVPAAPKAIETAPKAAAAPEVETKIKELLKLVEGTGTDIEQVKMYVDPIIKEVQKEVDGLHFCSEANHQDIKELRQQVADLQNRESKKETIVYNPLSEVKINVGRTHFQFDALFKKTVALRTVKRFPWITGGAGGGKTHAAAQIAEALNIPFSSMSVSSQMTQTALFGYQNANGDYITTPFREAYQNGGVFCLDEIDNGNSNILAALNSALANGLVNFADQQVKMHKDFYLVATANTTGNGATKSYVGRNQIDNATKDRFFFVHWNYDEALELELMAQGNRVAFDKVKALRDQAEKSGLQCVISPRATQGIAVLLEIGYSLNEAVNDLITEKLTPQEKTALNLN